MAEMKADARNLGVAPARIHIATFNGSEPMTPGVVVGTATRTPHAPERTTQHRAAGLVRTQRHRRTLELVSLPEYVRFAEACDVPVRWSCRTGVCHGCESGLVSGAVAYGPEPLDKPAEGNVLVCCSQPSATSSSIYELEVSIGRQTQLTPPKTAPTMLLMTAAIRRYRRLV